MIDYEKLLVEGVSEEKQEDNKYPEPDTRDVVLVGGRGLVRVNKINKK